MRMFNRFPRAAAAVFALALLVPVVAPRLLAQQAPAAQPPIDPQTILPLDPDHQDRDAAERPQVLHPPERAAGEARVAAAGGEGRIARGSRRPAGARAPHRAHGVQRQRPFQAGRARQLLRVGRRAARPARQRLHELRRDGLHARPADRPGRRRRARADGARRFRRRPDARSGRSRQGTRRRHRGVARRPRRRLAHPRQADPDPLLQLALRRAAADRQAGDHPRTRRRRGCAPSTTPGIAPSGMAVIAVGDIDPRADRGRHHDARSARFARARRGRAGPGRHGAAPAPAARQRGRPIPR